MHELHIITPIYHPSHVPVIYHSVEEAAKGLKVVWWVVFDHICAKDGEDWRIRFLRKKNENLLINCKVSEIEDTTGFTHKNHILDELESELTPPGDLWIYFLDDNNTLPVFVPAFIRNSDEGREMPHGFVYISTDKNEPFKKRRDYGFRLSTLKGQRFIDSRDRFFAVWYVANHESTFELGERGGHFNSLD